MFHIWHKAKNYIKRKTIASDMGSTGPIGVVIDGGPLDCELVRLACLVAKHTQRKIYLLFIIEVPRILPLKASLPSESAFADAVLAKALALVYEIGCEATAEIVQTRDAGSAIVDEAKDQSYALLMLSLVRTPHTGLGTNPPLHATFLYILSHATCRVWAIQNT